MTTEYRLKKDYTSYYYGIPVIVPSGTIVSWFEHAQKYITPAIGGYVIPLTKWAVEGWRDYFERVTK